MSIMEEWMAKVIVKDRERELERRRQLREAEQARREQLRRELVRRIPAPGGPRATAAGRKDRRAA